MKSMVLFVSVVKFVFVEAVCFLKRGEEFWEKSCFYSTVETKISILLLIPFGVLVPPSSSQKREMGKLMVAGEYRVFHASSGLPLLGVPGQF